MQLFLQLKDTIEAEFKSRGLQINPVSVLKVIQLYETKSSRHAVMIVGATQSAKTVTWRVLQSTLTSLSKAGDPNFTNVKVQ